MAYRPYKKNANGTLTDIPLYADMADKDGNGNNIVATYQRIMYDLVITNQTEFDAFMTKLKNSSCNSKNVLIVNNGTAYSFTSTGAIKLKTTLKRIDGWGNPTINIIDAQQGNYSTAQFYYSTAPTTSDYGMKNITFNCTGKSGATIYILKNMINIENVKVVLNASGMASCFSNCDNIKDCYAEIHSGGGSWTIMAFSSCDNVINCTGYAYVTDTSSYPVAFSNCTNLVNCYGYANGTTKEPDAYYQCTGLTNCVGTIVCTTSYGRAFCACSLMVNCLANSSASSTGHGQGYSGCSYGSNCKAGDISHEVTYGTMTKWDSGSCD